MGGRVPVYMCTCATFPEPTETFKAEVKLPWSGEYKVLNDDRDLQCVFNMFMNRNLKTIRIDVELQALAVAALPPEEIDADNLAFNSLESHNNSAKRVRQSNAEVVDLSTDNDGNNGEQPPSYASLPSEDDEDYVPNSNS
ncbi:hypothetical protein Ddye_026113 [Dipteronia dyeriana]|uniref:Uncharacterized protein n=1 Tax=Dipteronia dyeriana TaxID=168575 RepID=A0AAD9TME0_9ROSI|nr:hypothetical protein Ddye_026113 [Dipteronia dyeriana]